MFKHYKFIDYATQAYLLIVGILILFFHNSTVHYWSWLVAGHVITILLVHLLVTGYALAKQPAGWLDFLRHFYPVLLYTPLF